MHEEILKQRAHKEEKIRQEALEIAEKIKVLKLIIGAKTSTKGKIFGSVNTIQISEALKNQGFTIDRKDITIKEELIKEIGNYTATVRLHRDVSVEIPFEIIAE
jgi:large subunit ribosomal protein L9